MPRLTEKDHKLHARPDSASALADSCVHGLNNVLASILLAAHSLAENRDPSGSRALLASVEAAISHGREQLDLLQACCGGRRGESVDLPVVALVETAAHAARRRLEPATSIVTRYEADLPLLRCRPGRLFELLLGVLRRAAEGAPPACGLTIRCAVGADGAARAHGGGRLEILVQPCDLPARELDRLNRSAASAGGRLIRVDAADGPVGWKIVLSTAEPRRSGDQVDAANGAPTGRGQLLLLADDDESFVRTIAEALRLFGYEVLTAANGREAIEIYGRRGSEIKLLITDLAMPELGGLSTIRHLGEIDRGLRAIVVTGVAGQESQVEALGPVVRGIVRKPIHTAELLRCIATALGSGSAVS